MNGYVCMDSFHPIVKEWFLNTFSCPSKPQQLGWPEVNEGKNVLICAPTGSGKTMAAFLKCLDTIYQSKEVGNTKNYGFKVVYISPLKALNNDIYRNLEIPIKGIEETAKKASILLPQLSVGIRTGDTTQKERRDMIKNPPDILITTPESLFIMLTAEGTRTLFSTVEFVIIDEIHAIVSNKRGTHLAVSLERLEKLANRSLIRIGLSATLNPLEEVAAYLGGFCIQTTDTDISITQRHVTIVNCNIHKKLDLIVDIPVKNMMVLENNSIWPDIYRQIYTLICSHKSTLIFVNDRRQAESVASGINNLSEDLLVKTHHGSMDKEVRREIERHFRDGVITCLVATSTLELGIDIGQIDLVIQVGAPQTASQMLQRIGRAGHRLDALSKGYIIPKTRADLLRAAFIGFEVKKYDVENVHIPMNCFDILAQQVISLAGTEKKWEIEEAYFLIRGAYPYKDLSMEQFESVLWMLSNPSPEDEPGIFKPRIMYDRPARVFWGTDLGRMLSFLGAGTITDKGNYPVYERETNKRVGELQEEFVFETRVGERFLLGSSVWRLDTVEHDRVFVTRANESGGKIPFWIGDQVLWDFETGRKFGFFLRQLEEHISRENYLLWIEEQCGLGRTAAENLRDYIQAQNKYSGYIATDRRIVCEFFSDETGQSRLIIQSTFGGKVNAVLAVLIHHQLVLSLQCDIEYMYNDEGMLFHIIGYPGELTNVFSLLFNIDFENELFTLLPSMQIFNMNLRYNLTRALMVNVKQAGKRLPLWIQRLRSAEMVESISKIPNHPMIQETYRECFYDFLDVRSAYALLEKIKMGQIEAVDVYTAGPSPFSSELVFGFWQIYQYIGDMPIAEKRNQLLVTDKSILKLAVGEGGEYELLDERAINAIESNLLSQKYNRSIKNADDLYYFIFSFGELKAEPYQTKSIPGLDEKACIEYLQGLEEQGRIIRIQFTQNGKHYWIAVEDFPMYCKALALDKLKVKITLGLLDNESELLAGEWINSYILGIDPDTIASVMHILRRRVRFIGPFTIKDIQKEYPISTKLLESALKKLIVLGELTLLKNSKKTKDIIYCQTKVYEQIRRKTVELARIDIKPKKRETYLSFICKFQKVTESIKQGDELLMEVIKQQKGVFLPIEYWERFVFPARVKKYYPQMLDSLCSTGIIRWIGRMNKKTKEIAFYPGEDFLRVISFENHEISLNEQEKRVHDLLTLKPARFSFEYTSELKMDQLMFMELIGNLVWKGLVNNDLFSPVRYYQDKKTKNACIKYGAYPQMGRWSVIQWSKSINDTEQLKYYVEMLLDRYGIISKEILQFEKPAISWAEAYNYLKQSEFFSGIKRGVFLDDISGIQYSRDEIIEDLRLHETALVTRDEYITLSSCDMANLTSIYKNTSNKVSRNPGTAIVYHNGSLVLLIKQYGKVIVPVVDDEKIILKAIKCFIEAFQKSCIWSEHSSVLTLYWQEEGQPIERTKTYLKIKELGYASWYKGIILYK